MEGSGVYPYGAGPFDDSAAEIVDAYRDIANAPTDTLGLPSPTFKHYPEGQRIPLPWSRPGPVLPAGDGLDEVGALLSRYAPARLHVWTYRAMVALTGAVVGQAVGQGPLDPADDHAYGGLLRPVASGGALFPGEIYLAWTGSAALAVGLYHYDAVHHGLVLIRPGDPTPTLAAALPGPATPRAALLLACRVWKNVGRYHNFGYRLGCVDMGVLLGQLMSTPGADRVHLLFDQDRVDAAAGLDPGVESVYAIVTVGRRGGLPPAVDTNGNPDLEAKGDANRDPNLDANVAATAASPGGPTGTGPDRLAAAAVGAPARALHEASGRGPLTRRQPPAHEGAPAGREDAPPTGEAWFGRRSVAAFRPGGVTTRQLEAVMAFIVAGLGDPVWAGEIGVGDLQLYCAVPRSHELAPGIYRFEPAQGRLRCLRTEDPTGALLRAATRFEPRMVAGPVSVFAVGAYAAGIEVVGARWYRMLNMVAGVAIHRTYVAAASVGLGCRAALGFDAELVAGLMALDAGRTALAQVLVGRPAPRPGWLMIDLPRGRTTALP
jgi:SagB-type dehydrogenase family enzyme